MKKERKYFILILTLIGFCTSCQKKDEAAIDMSNIDFSNIENLYEQPLPVIQKCVEGKWRLQYKIGGLIHQKIIDSLDNYMYIYNDRIVMGHNQRVIIDSPITWEKMKSIYGYDTYFLNSNHEISFFFLEIKNDTLVVEENAYDGYLYNYTKIY